MRRFPVCLLCMAVPVYVEVLSAKCTLSKNMLHVGEKILVVFIGEGPSFPISTEENDCLSSGYFDFAT